VAAALGERNRLRDGSAEESVGDGGVRFGREIEQVRATAALLRTTRKKTKPSRTPFSD
jgi:hypothetical protein